jgi:hypothetical protein
LVETAAAPARNERRQRFGTNGLLLDRAGLRDAGVPAASCANTELPMQI